MEIMEISAHWQDWKACVREAKKQPLNLIWQYMAAKAQMKLVCYQAQYFAEVRA
jgi:tripartite-type tricarboxylate transporter receptor subunit TctC